MLESACMPPSLMGLLRCQFLESRLLAWRRISRTYGTSLVRCWLGAMAFTEGLWWRTLPTKIISAIYCAGLDDCSGIEMVGAGGTQQHFRLSGQSIYWAALIFGRHRSRFKLRRFSINVFSFVVYLQSLPI